MNKDASAKSLDSSRIAPNGMDLDSSIGDVLSLMSTAVYICDVQGRITFYNPRAEELWGRKPFLNDDNEKFCGSFRLWSLAGAEIPRERTPMATVLKTGSGDYRRRGHYRTTRQFKDKRADNDQNSTR